MKAEIIAQAMTEEIAKTVISKSVGLTAEECVTTLEIIEDFCEQWVKQIKEENRL